MIKRKCPCCKEKTISVFIIAYNLHFDSKENFCFKCNSKYMISYKWDFLRRLFWLVLVIWYLLPYVVFYDFIFYDLLVVPYGNNLLILYNLVVVLFPLLFMEIVILSIFPLEVDCSI